MSSRIPTVGKIVIGGLKTTPKLTLPGTPESGKAGAYLNKTNPQKNIIPPGTLRKYSERRFNIEPYYTIPGDPYAADVGKRQDRTVFRPITKPSSSDYFEYKLNIGENMSYSKEVLKEFQYDPVYGRKQKPDYMLQPPMAIPGAGASGGTLRPGRSIGALIGAGISAVGGLLTRNKPVEGFIQPGTGGPRRGGRGPRTPNTGGGSGGGKRFIRDSLSDLISGIRKGLGIFGTGALVVIGVYKYVTREGKRILDQVIDALPLTGKQKEWLKANTMIVIIAIGLTAGTAEAARRLTPRIMKVLRNRRIAAEIGEALDAGDETLARTILLDAIEDENINLSAIRRKLGDDDYERLYRDYL